MKYLPTKFTLDRCYIFRVLRAKRCTDRQTDRQKQADHNNPLLTMLMSSVKNETKVFCMIILMNFTQNILQVL